jgi:SM-20-related protein
MSTSIPVSLFADLQHQGWAVGNDIVSSEICSKLKLWAEVRKQAGDFSEAHMGRGSERYLFALGRGDSTFWLENNMQPEIFEILESLRLQLNENFYFGLQYFECHLTCYPPGACYQPHTDKAHESRTAESERVISFVLYLNEDWQKTDGGELVFSRSGEQVLPLIGRLALFLSDTIEHEVLPALRDRWSLTGWFRRRTL